MMILIMSRIATLINTIAIIGGGVCSIGFVFQPQKPACLYNPK